MTFDELFADPPLRCRLGWHRYQTVRKFIRGISLYEHVRCQRCRKRTTIYNGVDELAGWR